jgi:hypothetical protein
MTEPNFEPVPLSGARQQGWRLLARGVEVRFRFLFLLGLLAALMAGWPWLRAGWDRFVGLWSKQNPQTSVSADTEYFCPMDPGIINAWPAICPICNMDLIPRKKTDAVILPEGVVARMQFSPYRVQLAGIRTSPVEVIGPSESGNQQKLLAVPTTAIVHHGDQHVVYVETMPGMFDGVLVELGSRHDDAYVVESGLRAGQRVASSGVFLIDAESRLNANVATQYFGAGSSSRKPDLPKRRANQKPSPLSDADLALVNQQQTCPVTDAPLGSMGTPVFTMIDGRKVFLCCRGCESGLLADPEKYLAKIGSKHAGAPDLQEEGKPEKNTSPK